MTVLTGTCTRSSHYGNMLFTPERSAGLARLADFLPRTARAYANSRNHDNGTPDDGQLRGNVSQLSPWLHAGLLSEREVVDAVLGQHSANAAEKFIAEVFWRIYFKGYLEQRPTVWREFCKGREAAFERVESNAGLKTAYDEAVEGRTGIAAFDHWVHELVETGYLHNHARMWFASIWIFTLKLDWQLGADFFLRHLADGDAASNTLSWRWIGGLHTKGKIYLARPDNIARYTADHPEGPLGAEDLADEAPALEEDIEHTRNTLDLPRPVAADGLSEPYALILHDEGASHVPLNLPHPPALVIAAARPDARSSRPVGDTARRFANGAVESGANQAAQAFQVETAKWTTERSIVELLEEAGINKIAMPYLPTGWTRDALIEELSPLIDEGHATIILDDLNRATWPYAKAGFFGVKKKIESVLREVGVSGTPIAASA